MTHEPITNDDQFKNSPEALQATMKDRERILYGLIKQLFKEVSAKTLNDFLPNFEQPFPDIDDKIGDYIAWELRERHKRVGHING